MLYINGMKPLDSCMNSIQADIAEGKKGKAYVITVFVLPIVEAIGCAHQLLVATPVRILDFGYKWLVIIPFHKGKENEHADFQSIYEGIGKAILLALNILIAPIYGLADPKKNYEYHQVFDLIPFSTTQKAKPTKTDPEQPLRPNTNLDNLNTTVVHDGVNANSDPTYSTSSRASPQPDTIQTIVNEPSTAFDDQEVIQDAMNQDAQVLVLKDLISKLPQKNKEPKSKMKNLISIVSHLGKGVGKGSTMAHLDKISACKDVFVHLTSEEIEALQQKLELISYTKEFKQKKVQSLINDLKVSYLKILLKKESKIVNLDKISACKDVFVHLTSEEIEALQQKLKLMQDSSTDSQKQQIQSLINDLNLASLVTLSNDISKMTHE